MSTLAKTALIAGILMVPSFFGGKNNNQVWRFIFGAALITLTVCGIVAVIRQ